MKRTNPTIDPFGNQYWYNWKGQIHNEFGPAITYDDGSEIWYKNGKRHNDFGPALILDNGYKCWYIDGVKLTEAEFKQHKIDQFLNQKLTFIEKLKNFLKL